MKRRIGRSIARTAACIVAAFAFAFALCGCSESAGPDARATPEELEAANLVILHTNDTHGYDQAADGVLGTAAVAQLKKDYEAKGCNVLLLHAGDSIQGNVLVNEEKGADVPAFMNAARYDAMVIGNHEFDYGADTLEKLMDEFSFPVLGANIIVDATGELFAVPNAVFEYDGGLKVGVFGITTPETKTASSPKNTAGLTFAEGDALIECVQSQVDELRSKGCGLVVCLGHVGEAKVCEPNVAAQIAASTSGIDIFIDGHDHEVENQTVNDKDGNPVLIVETGCYLANVGVLSYKDGSWTEELVAAGSYDGSDPDVAAIVDADAAEIEARLVAHVATTAFALDGNRFPGTRDRETNLGDLVADAYAWEAEQAFGEAPDAALFNGGAIRTGIDAGDITMKEIVQVSPFGNQICVIDLTGQQLLVALEASTQGSPDEMGSFPQVSGITFTLDTGVPYERGERYQGTEYYAPANPGARVTISDVGGKGFDPDATYTIATTEFVVSGGDAFHGIAEAAGESRRYTGYIDTDALGYYLEDELGGAVPERYSAPQGRITVVGS